MRPSSSSIAYQAEHLTTGEQVVLKTVRLADHAMLSSIRREIHALRRIDHSLTQYLHLTKP